MDEKGRKIISQAKNNVLPVESLQDVMKFDYQVREVGTQDRVIQDKAISEIHTDANIMKKDSTIKSAPNTNNKRTFQFANEYLSRAKRYKCKICQVFNW